MWGTCANGTEAVGCGRPETFRNCADVTITTSTGGGVPPEFASADNPYQLYVRDLRAPNYVFPLVIRSQVCLPTPRYRRIPGITQWCETNCLRYPPNCPPSVCHCPDTCEGIGDIAGKEGADVYCQDQCIVYRDVNQCPPHRCRCY